MLLPLLLLVITLIIILYYKRKLAFNYWKERNVPTLPEHPHWFFGHFKDCILGRMSFIDRYNEAHKEFRKQGHKLGGMYLRNMPIILVVDAELKRKMLQSDASTFSARGIAFDAKNNPLSAHMFNLDGEQWHNLRRLLSPTFTSGKIKMMLPLIEKHVDILIKVMKNITKSGEDINFSPWLDRTGIDVIGHVAFGLDCNTLESENETFFEMTSRIMHAKKWKTLKELFFGLSSPANVITLITSDQEMCEYFINLIKETVRYRLDNNIKANDFLQLLIDMIKDDDSKDDSGLTMMEITAQSFIFFVAAFETTSRTVDYALYALAKAQDEQNLLRKSIQKELETNNGLYLYDWLMNNERLDIVIKETLRLYAPAVGLNRKTTSDYRVEEMNVTIPCGTNVVFSSFGFHHDPEYFDNPMEFRPERFTKENLNAVQQMANVSFGEGPRFCIGKRFAYIESKLILAKVIANFEILPSKKTVYPLEISPLAAHLILQSKTPIYYKFNSL